jgi:ferredoxin, 2Fe-2S
MTVAVKHDVPGIDGECGGDMACGTCHVYLDEGSCTAVTPPADDEIVMSDSRTDVRVDVASEPAPGG